MPDWLPAVIAVLLSALAIAARISRAEAHNVEHIDRQVQHLEGFIMSATQDTVNAVVAQLAKSKDEIVARIAEVQEQLDNAERPEDVDLSALTAAAQALDDIVPDVPAAVPADEPPAEVDPGDAPAEA